MDVLSADWQCELGLEDPHLIGECPARDDSADYSLDEFISSPLSPESFPSYISLTDEASAKQLIEQDQLETNPWNSFTTENMILDETLSSSYVASSTHSQQLNRNPNCNVGESKETQTAALNRNPNCSNDNNSDAVVENCKGTGKVQATSRPPAQARNHIIAERKRRERLNQKLIALSALIPGLKKMDKASIIGDAITYIKQLKEHVETLERKMDGSTGTSPKRFRPSDDDDSTPPPCDYLCGNSNQVLPNIEAKARDKNVHVRIHCETQDGVIEKVLREMQMINLDVLSSSMVPFGNVSLDISVIAQMTAEFGKTEEEIVETLRQLF